ncbi:hypothetical protein BS17DRAFT_784191 [Gyrodon lividus]|nr:hypothetical protein BS17DRAFT_784191 [Gyrodon lividus]
MHQNNRLWQCFVLDIFTFRLPSTHYPRPVRHSRHSSSVHHGKHPRSRRAIPPFYLRTASIRVLTRWHRSVNALGHETAAMLIYDEIQVGRNATYITSDVFVCTGSELLWAHSVLPATMAKPLANGYPTGAVMLRDSIAWLAETCGVWRLRIDDWGYRCGSSRATFGYLNVHT